MPRKGVDFAIIGTLVLVLVAGGVVSYGMISSSESAQDGVESTEDEVDRQSEGITGVIRDSIEGIEDIEHDIDDTGGSGGQDSSFSGSMSGDCSLPSEAITKSGFENGPMEPFNEGRITDQISTVSGGVDGSALKVHVNGGSHRGVSATYNFEKAGMADPEELWAQYAIKFGENWRADRNGKLPGFGGSYASGAAHGGGRVDGTDGWSARGEWKEGSSQTKTRVGYYVYHVNMDGNYGDWYGDHGGRKELENGQWYCIKQHIKLNDPDQKNGVLEMWVDGDKVVDANDIRFRTVNRLKIKDYWFNLYYGGTWTAPQDMDVYFDNFAVSKQPLN